MKLLLLSLILLPLSISNASPTLTYTKDIKPLIQKHCASCHGGLIPTIPNLLNYEEAFAKREQILQRVWVDKSMPMGNPMDDRDRKMFKEWIEQGAQK